MEMWYGIRVSLRRCPFEVYAIPNQSGVEVCSSFDDFVDFVPISVIDIGVCKESGFDA